jgi:hypothetical protein
MRRRLGPLALLALLGSACGEPRLLEGFTEGQTRIRLRPSDFIGSVECGRGVDGALQSYIARLQELSAGAAPDAGFTTTLTTTAVPCDQAVLFPAIAGRRYGAEIYGFDTEAPTEADLGRARWTSVCGRGSSEPVDAGLDPYRPTLSERGVTVFLRGCTPFSGEPGAPTRLIVDTASALGPLQCGSGPGQVLALRGTLEGETRVAACQEPLVFEVPAEGYYTIELTGLAADGDAGVGDAGAPPAVVSDAGPIDAGADAGDALDASLGSPADAGTTPAAPPTGIPRWQTRCVGRALVGATATAVCDPLRPLASASP